MLLVFVALDASLVAEHPMVGVLVCTCVAWVPAATCAPALFYRRSCPSPGGSDGGGGSDPGPSPAAPVPPRGGVPFSEPRVPRGEKRCEWAERGRAGVGDFSRGGANAGHDAVALRAGLTRQPPQREHDRPVGGREEPHDQAGGKLEARSAGRDVPGAPQPSMVSGWPYSQHGSHPDRGCAERCSWTRAYSPGSRTRASAVVLLAGLLMVASAGLICDAALGSRYPGRSAVSASGVRHDGVAFRCGGREGWRRRLSRR